jgi:hypothetical protein
MDKFYWCHSESECVGMCDSEEELFKMMEEPCVEPINKATFDELKSEGWSQ